MSTQFDLIKLSLSERIFVKLRGDRELTGVLHVSILVVRFLAGADASGVGIRLAWQPSDVGCHGEHIDSGH